MGDTIRLETVASGSLEDKAPVDVLLKDPHKYTIHMGRFDLPGVCPPLRHATCKHNERVAIHNRVLKKVPQMTPAGYKMGQRVVRHLSQLQLPLEDEETFLSRYSGAKRKRYAQALDENRVLGTPPWMGKITMFVKNESLDPRKKTNPDPRAIQFRDANYAAELASYLKPIEHLIYNTRLYGKNYGVGRVIGKGLNMGQRAKLIERKFNNLPNCVVVSIDAKRFDLHVNEQLLNLEHAYYLKFNNDPRFRELLRMQLVNKARTRSGLRYTVKGGRMSGDMNTGLGNCVISLIMFKALVQKLQLPMDLLVDGDDALLFISRENLEKLESIIVPHYLEFGMEMAVEEVAYEMEQINWCQTRPVLVQGKWIMIRDPRRTLANVLVSKKWQPHRQRDYMSAIALCEMSLNRGVPVLQTMSQALWRNGSGTPNILDEERKEAVFGRVLNFHSWEQLVKRGMDSQVVSMETRLSFERAFGITVQEQISWEQYLDQWQCGFGLPEIVDDYWDVVKWEPTTNAPSGYFQAYEH